MFGTALYVCLMQVSNCVNYLSHINGCLVFETLSIRNLLETWKWSQNGYKIRPRSLYNWTWFQSGCEHFVILGNKYHEQKCKCLLQSCVIVIKMA